MVAGTVQARYCKTFFFFVSGEFHHITRPAHGVYGAEDSIRLLMAKNPGRSNSCVFYLVSTVPATLAESI